MKALKIKNEMLDNLLQTFYTVYLENPAFGLFLAHRNFDVKIYRLHVSLWFLFLSTR